MIGSIQEKLFDYLADFFSKYGIPIEYVYNQDLDLLKEYQKAIAIRLKDRKLNPEIGQSYSELNLYNPNIKNEKYGIGVGVFSRTPISKSSLYGNNNKIQVINKNDPESIIVRDVFSMTVNYTVEMVFDNHDLCDIAEIMYVSELSGLNKTIYLNLQSVDRNGVEREELSNIPYNLSFSGINNIGKINESNLRTISFNIDVSGLIFLPFIKNSDNLIEEIRLDLHGFDRRKQITDEVFWIPTKDLPSNSDYGNTRFLKKDYQGNKAEISRPDEKELEIE